VSDTAEDTEYVEGNAASEDADRPRRLMVAKTEGLPAFIPIDSAHWRAEELEGEETAEANAPVLPDFDNAPRSKRMAVAVTNSQILSPTEAVSYRRWQTAVAAYRRAGAALEAAKAEADAAVVELAKYAGKETL
jgi:hypothetical protein